MAIRQHADYLRDFVRGLKWDGVSRLDNWGSKHFTTQIEPLANEWGRVLMTGLGLRLLSPGTKVDSVCILTGPQGIGKSTFFEALSTFEGRAYYAACTHMNTSEGDAKRTQGITWAASVIVDLAEGVIFRSQKANQDLIKQEVSQVEDQFRLPYEKDIRTVPRGFIFVGTSNRTDLLSDLTGSRRWFMLPARSIVPLDYETKLQILAEVVARETELRNSKWYDLRLTLDDLPEAMREEHSTVTDVRELLNTGYAKTDTFSEDLLALIEAGQLPTVIGELEHTYYLTTHFLAVREGNLNSRSKQLIGTLINGLAESPTFPFSFEKKRVSPNRLVTPRDVNTGKPLPIEHYVTVPSSTQTQGWWLRPKPNWKPRA